uniref:Uncharacterized protein n=1 Tax=Cynoglossus semilaevis TaxID=244447 RepID=A0A3P8WAG6_CYNSE
MEHELRMGLSVWAITAIVCNSVVGVLILVLFIILCKACKVPSHTDKMLTFTVQKQPSTTQRYLLTVA